jgi:transcriptional regulator with XRE-family HTH domain
VAKKKKRAVAARESPGDRIRRYRLQKGRTQTQLRALIGVSQRVFANYEVNRISAPPKFLVRIADALNVSTHTLLGRKRGPDRGREGQPQGDVRRQRHLKRLDELSASDRKAIFRSLTP